MEILISNLPFHSMLVTLVHHAVFCQSGKKKTEVSIILIIILPVDFYSLNQTSRYIL